VRLVARADGSLVAAGAAYRCALGRGGVSARKREGDGATPLGVWPLRFVLYRPDRVARPRTTLPVLPLWPWDGWCDDADDEAYNRYVPLPYPARHERLWRADALYDLIVVLGYNDGPVVAGAGSAIFLHVAAPDSRQTEGCVALAEPDLRAVLARVASGSALEITP
jgi:L,D-peptidoglycan transpeptidase YkuD (ErfK/YbiS/YcfS/YnhG family)